MTKNSKILCVIISVCLFECLSSEFRAYAPLSKEITLHGRYYVQSGSVVYDWACFKIHFCFKETTKIIWNVVDAWNIYHVVLDGNSTKTVHPKKDEKITIFQAENPESHCLEIIKITQDHYGPYRSRKDSIFNGIQIEGGALAKSSKRYDYKLDFLGDSITTAYGVMSGRNPVCFFYMKQIQNCRESWAVHLSRMLNAEYRLEAVSGKGVIRNMIGVPGAKMPALFTRLSDNSKDGSYTFQDHYAPDALFVFIGENDYYYNIKTPSMNKFVNGYVSMLEKIVKDYMVFSDSVPKIINICDIEYSKQLCNNVKKAVKTFSFEFNLVYYLEIPEGTIGRQRFGCIGHPNSEGQRRIAQSIYAGVKSILSQ